jgi:hypothetical protein
MSLRYERFVVHRVVPWLSESRPVPVYLFGLTKLVFGLTVYSQFEMLSLRYKLVDFGAGTRTLSLLALCLFGLTNLVGPGSFPLQRRPICTAHPAFQIENSR